MEALHVQSPVPGPNPYYRFRSLSRLLPVLRPAAIGSKPSAWKVWISHMRGFLHSLKILRSFPATETGSLWDPGYANATGRIRPLPPHCVGTT